MQIQEFSKEELEEVNIKYLFVEIPSVRGKFNKRYDLGNSAFYGVSQAATPATAPTTPTTPAAARPRVTQPVARPRTVVANATVAAKPAAAKNQTTTVQATTLATDVEDPHSSHKVSLTHDDSDSWEFLKPDTFEFSQDGEERKYTGVFPWWLSPLIVLGAILIVLLLFCTMSKTKNKPVAGKAKPIGAETNEAGINREIEQQLQQRVQNP